MGGWYDGGYGAAEWTAMIVMMALSWAALTALIVWAVRSGRGDRPRAGRDQDAGRAESLLAERFARGEIGVDEFTERRELLRSATTSRR